MNDITITLEEYNRIMSVAVTLELVKKLVDSTSSYDAEDCKKTIQFLKRFSEDEA